MKGSVPRRTCKSCVRQQLRANAHDSATLRRNTRMENMTATNQLASLRRMCKVVADTGDESQIKFYQPEDVTTNPSLVLQVIDRPAYQDIIKQALVDEKSAGISDSTHTYAGVVDRIAVGIGARMLELVPGSVSTECDARIAYDTQATVSKARRLLGLYAKKGIHVDRIYIKIASTWEGIRAAEILQREGIRTNMTLMFDFYQAVACAQAKASLISPFVGRILDWYKAREGRDFSPEEDPGVISVKRIFYYYKKFNIPTIVMGASFRSVGEIQELAGCDSLTIAPKLLASLATIEDPLPQKLDASTASDLCQDEFLDYIDEETFRAKMAENEMASEKLAEGVRRFAEDQEKCEQQIAELAASWGLEL